MMADDEKRAKLPRVYTLDVPAEHGRSEEALERFVTERLGLRLEGVGVCTGRLDGVVYDLAVDPPRSVGAGRDFRLTLSFSEVNEALTLGECVLRRMDETGSSFSEACRFHQVDEQTAVESARRYSRRRVFLDDGTPVSYLVRRG